MATTRNIASPADLSALRQQLDASARKAVGALRHVLQSPDPLARLKFERLGCDPLDLGDAQNLAEQIDRNRPGNHV
jgi:hypothetical protein